MRTAVQVLGDSAEALAEAYLIGRGWTILARQARVHRFELDIVAIDPGPPARLVAVEVRWRARREFGLAEESLGRPKLTRLRTAIGMLAAEGSLADGRALPRLPIAVDLVTIEPPRRPGDEPRLRHHRDVLA